MQYPEFFFSGGSKAYLVGINDYDFVRRLQTTHADCEGLMDVLHTKHKFQVQLLKDATKIALEALLTTIKDECKQDSRIIFYFAGHGIAEGADDINKRPEGYLLVKDSQRGETSTYVEMRLVLEMLGQLPCRHLLIILDCCYAGAIKYSMDTRSLGFAVPKTLYQEKFEYYVKEPAKQVITSAAYNQKAIDSLGERGMQSNNRSPFADSLIEALDSGDASWTYANIKPDGIVTSSEIGFFLSLKVSEMLTRNNVPFSDQQTPSVFPLIGSNKLPSKGEFIFIDSLDKMLALPKNPRQNPYKGLNAYSEKDNNLFYGRQRVLTGWWEGKVYRPGLLSIIDKSSSREKKPVDDKDENSLSLIYRVLVTGRSGIGKSSLVKAGVMAKLALSGNQTAIITPGPTPFTTHSKLLQNINDSDLLYYLLVDQYEELITQCTNEDELNKFENALVQLADEKKAVVLVTMRTDIERQFKKSIFLQPTTQDKFYRFIVPNFTRDEIKEIIIQPAAQSLLEFIGTRYEGEINQNEELINNRFVEKIIDEAFANPDSMPMLSETLSRLYEKKEPGSLSLTEDIYNDFGGISGILNTKFKEVYESLDDENKRLFRQLIFRMISYDTGYLAKRRVFTSLKNNSLELNEIAFSDDMITRAMLNIRETLQASRLITSSDDRTQNNVYVEPSHDALLNNSDLVAQWQKQKHEFTSNAGEGISFQSRISIQNALANSAANYYFSEKRLRKGHRWKDDPRLGLVMQMINKGEFQPNKIEEAFIKDSRKAKVLGRRIFYSVALSMFGLVLIAAIILVVKNAEINLEKKNVQNRLAINYLENSEASYSDSDQLKSLLLLANAVDLNRDTLLNKLMLQRIAFYDQSLLLSGVLKCGGRVEATKLTNNGAIITLRLDSAIEVWDMNVLKKIYTQNGKAEEAFVNEIGSRLYVLHNSTLNVIDIAAKKIIKSVRFSPENPISIQSALQENKLLVIEGESLHVLDSNLTEAQPSLRGSGFIVSPDAHYATYRTRSKNEAHVYLAKLDPPFSTSLLYSSAPKVYSCAFSRRSELLAFTSGDDLVVRNVQGSETKRMKVENNSTHIFFSANDRHLVIEYAEHSRIYSVASTNDQLFIKAKSNIPDIYLKFYHDPYNNKNDFIYSSETATYDMETGREQGLLDYYYEADVFSDANDEFGLLKYTYDGFLKKMNLGDTYHGMSFTLDTKNLGFVSEKHTFHDNILTIRRDSIVYIYKHTKPYIQQQADAIYCAFSNNGRYSFSINTQGIVVLHDIVNNTTRYAKNLHKTFPNIEGMSAIVSDDGETAVFSFCDSGFIFNFKKDKCIRFRRNYFKNIEIVRLNKYNFESRNIFQSEGYSFINGSNRIAYRSDGFIYYYEPVNDHYFNKKRLDNKFIDRPISISKDGRSYMALNDSSNILYRFQLFGGKHNATQVPKRLSEGDEDGPVLKILPFNKAALVSNLEMELFVMKSMNFSVDKKITNNVQIIDGEQKRVINFMLSQDNKFLVVLCTKGSLESQVHIYRTDTWQKLIVEHFYYSNELDLDHTMNSMFALKQFYCSDDGKQFFIVGPGKMLYINAATKKSLSLNFYSNMKVPRLSPLAASYHHDVLHVFDGKFIRGYGADLDFPPSLFQLQVAVITGAQLNSNNEAEAIPASQLADKWQEYQTAALDHLKTCRYKPYNLYKQLRDMRTSLH